MKRDLALIDDILGERENQLRRYFEKEDNTRLLQMLEDFLIRLIEVRVNREKENNCRDFTATARLIHVQANPEEFQSDRRIRAEWIGSWEY